MAELTGVCTQNNGILTSNLISVTAAVQRRNSHTRLKNSQEILRYLLQLTTNEYKRIRLLMPLPAT